MSRCVTGSEFTGFDWGWDRRAKRIRFSTKCDGHVYFGPLGRAELARVALLVPAVSVSEIHMEPVPHPGKISNRSGGSLTDGWSRLGPKFTDDIYLNDFVELLSLFESRKRSIPPWPRALWDYRLDALLSEVRLGHWALAARVQVRTDGGLA